MTETPYLAAPVSETPAVCVLSNHGSPLTASPGLVISRWWSRVSPVLSQHCATGIGASSPVHAAVVASRSDWTAPSETSSGEHPCRHDNLPISQQGCVCGRAGWRSAAAFSPPTGRRQRFTLHHCYLIARFPPRYDWRAKLICPVCDLREYTGRSATICVSTTSCPIRVSQPNVSHHRTPNQLKTMRLPASSPHEIHDSGSW